MLIDTHCHLNFPDFQQDQNQVIKRASARQVEKIVLASASVGESLKNIRLALKYPNLWTMAGIHPHNTDPGTKAKLAGQRQKIESLIKISKENKIVAVGEIGLDYFSTPSQEENQTKEEQIWLFEQQLKLAEKYQLPAVIHTRKAAEETLKIIKEFPKIKKVIHCFSYPYQIAKKFLDLDCLISFTGIITFPNADDLREIARRIPLEKIMLETDAPFLAPQEHRGERNEPAYVKIIAQCLAQTKKIDIGVITSVTTDTAESFFVI